MLNLSKDERYFIRLYYRGYEHQVIVDTLGVNIRFANKLMAKFDLHERRDQLWRHILTRRYIDGKASHTYTQRQGSRIGACFLNRIRQKYNIPMIKWKPGNQIITPEIEEQIINLYQSGMTAQEVTDKIEIFRTHKTILDTLNKHHIKCRDKQDYIQCDKTFFDNIDTEFKAYILGFLMTDGYVTRKYSIGLQITQQDEYILEEMIKQTKYQNLKVLHTKPSVSYINGRILNRHVMSRCVFECKEYFEALQRLGIVHNKSGKESFPRLQNQQLQQHFLRGIIDGDGCICISRKYLHCYICCSRLKFLQDIQKFINGLGYGGHIYKVKSSNPFYDFRISTPYLFLKDHIYKNANFFLKRKYLKFKQYEDYFIQKNQN